MWKRKEVKKRAKASLKANYWRCLLVAIILLAITGTGSGLAGGMAGGVAGGGVAAGSYVPYVTFTGPSGPAEADPAEALDPAAAGAPFELPKTGNADVDAALGELSEDPAFSAAMNQLASDPDTAGLMEQLSRLDWNDILVIMAVVGGILLVVFVIAFLIQLLLINPLVVGCRYFYAHNSVEKAPLGDLAEGFECGYGHVVGGMFLKDLFLFFWTLLFIIPGIIKSYSYRMVPYILADQPELSATAAITRSRQMMKGNKWRTFVLDLSFILWWLLSFLTLGLVGLFFVHPYYQATNGALYQALKGGEPGEPLPDEPAAPLPDEPAGPLAVEPAAPLPESEWPAPDAEGPAGSLPEAGQPAPDGESSL